MPLTIRPPGAVGAGVGHVFRDRTLREVAATAGTLSEVGHADFAFGLSFRQSGGRITRVDLTMTLTLEMPRWAHYRKRPAPERREWGRAMRALRVHEDGHLELFRAEAAKTLEALEAATPDTINDVLADETQRIQDLSDEYDRRTDHGRTQRTPHGTTEITPP